MAIFCGEEQRSRQPLRREIVKSSLKVFPMDNFGALEFCDHLFYLQIGDGTEKVIGQGKLTLLWKQEEDGWKIMRTISYDHQPLAEVELPDEILNQYLGDYTFSDRIVNIKKEGKLLRVTDIIDGKPGWNKELFPEAGNIFYLNFANVRYEFLKTGDQVDRLKIYEDGKLFEEGKKEL